MDERTSQVRQMVRIYSLSDRVLIDIGEETVDSNIAMDLIADTTASIEPEGDGIKAVHNLLSRPWFGRIWGK